MDGIDLTIEANTIYSLLGPNGAGKTTTLSILTTLLEPTAGWATVCGFDVVKQANEVRKRIGVTFQETVLDDALTGRQALDFHGRLYQQSKAKRQAKIEELLALVGVGGCGRPQDPHLLRGDEATPRVDPGAHDRARRAVP